MAVLRDARARAPARPPRRPAARTGAPSRRRAPGRPRAARFVGDAARFVGSLLGSLAEEVATHVVGKAGPSVGDGARVAVIVSLVVVLPTQGGEPSDDAGRDINPTRPSDADDRTR